MTKQTKLNLEELKVESFKTSLTIYFKGGSSPKSKRSCHSCETHDLKTPCVTKAY